MSLKDGKYSPSRLLEFSSIEGMSRDCRTDATTEILALVASFDTRTNPPDVLVELIKSVLAKYSHVSFGTALKDLALKARFKNIDEFGSDGLDGLCYHLSGHSVKEGIEALQKVLQRFDDLKEKDFCQVCNGAKGGVRGNENIIKGVVMCDYCHAEQMKKEGTSEAVVRMPACDVCHAPSVIDVRDIHYCDTCYQNTVCSKT